MFEPGTIVRNLFNGKVGEVVGWADRNTVLVLWDGNHRASHVHTTWLVEN